MHNLINSLINIIDNYTKYDFYIGQTNNPKERLRQHKQSKNFNFMIVIYKSSKEIYLLTFSRLRMKLLSKVHK